jgi:hypothetical protein
VKEGKNGMTRERDLYSKIPRDVSQTDHQYPVKNGWFYFSDVREFHDFRKKGFEKKRKKKKKK